jgi:hypothetical protein
MADKKFFLGRGDNNAHRHKVTVGTVDFQRVCAKVAKMYTHVKMYTHQHLLFFNTFANTKSRHGLGEREGKRHRRIHQFVDRAGIDSLENCPS